VLRNFFLRAKPWQVFVLVWGAYFVGQVIIISSLPVSTENNLRASLLTEAAVLPSIICFEVWLWAMGSFLFSLSQPQLKLNIHFFRFTIIFPTLYFLIVFPLFVSNSTLEVVMMPINGVGLVCEFYPLYFVAKSLLIAEKRQPVTRKDYTLTLIFLVFSLVGIWLVQPRVNRLYAHRAS
jgi:hypothetical protein